MAVDEDGNFVMRVDGHLAVEAGTGKTFYTTPWLSPDDEAADLYDGAPDAFGDGAGRDFSIFPDEFGDDT